MRPGEARLLMNVAGLHPKHLSQMVSRHVEQWIMIAPDVLDDLADWIDQIPACEGTGSVLRLKCREHRRG